MVSSLMTVSYHTAQAYALHKDADLPDRTNWSFCQKVRWHIMNKAGTVAIFLRCSPLLVTSALANFGTLTLCIAVEKEFAFFYIVAVLLSNFFVFLLPASTITSTLTCLGMAKTLPPPARPGAAKRDHHALFMTWTNLFLMSKTLEDPCFQRSAQMILMQWLRFLVNLVTLGILYTHISSHEASAANMEPTLFTYLTVNALNLLFIAFAYCCCSSQRTAEVSEDQADESEDDADAEERKRKTLDVVWEKNDTRNQVTTYLKTSES